MSRGIWIHSRILLDFKITPIANSSETIEKSRNKQKDHFQAPSMKPASL